MLARSGDAKDGLHQIIALRDTPPGERGANLQLAAHRSSEALLSSVWLVSTRVVLPLNLIPSFADSSCIAGAGQPQGIASTKLPELYIVRTRTTRRYGS